MAGDSGRVKELRQKTGAGIMTMPADPLRTRVLHLGRFVTVKGGAYFFMPGLRALRYLSSLGE